MNTGDETISVNPRRDRQDKEEVGRGMYYVMLVSVDECGVCNPQLGYGSLAKGTTRSSKTVTPPPPSPPSPPPHSTHTPPQESAAVEGEKQNSAKVVLIHYQFLGPSLLSRVTQCIADINEGFRNMVALHQMVRYLYLLASIIIGGVGKIVCVIMGGVKGQLYCVCLCVSGSRWSWV